LLSRAFLLPEPRYALNEGARLPNTGGRKARREPQTEEETDAQEQEAGRRVRALCPGEKPQPDKEKTSRKPEAAPRWRLLPERRERFAHVFDAHSPMLFLHLLLLYAIAKELESASFTEVASGTMACIGSILPGICQGRSDVLQPGSGGG